MPYSTYPLSDAFDPISFSGRTIVFFDTKDKNPINPFWDTSVYDVFFKHTKYDERVEFSDLVSVKKEIRWGFRKLYKYFTAEDISEYLFIFKESIVFVKRTMKNKKPFFVEKMVLNENGEIERKYKKPISWMQFPELIKKEYHLNHFYADSKSKD